MLAGAVWAGVYLALILTPLVVLWISDTPAGGGFWWEVSVALGFAVLLMMVVQFALTARFRRATAPFGIDIIYYFHRHLAWVVLVLVAAHPLLFALTDPGGPSRVHPATAGWAVHTGIVALALLLALVVTSVARKPLGIAYRPWRIAHHLLAVGAVGAGFVHMWGIGYYSGARELAVLWSVIGASVLAMVLWVRVLRPLRLSRTPWRVAGVRPDRGDCWLLSVEPDGHPGFGFRPGQFAWLSVRRSPYAMAEHPFSIASAPDSSGRLEFAIKQRGAFTRGIGQLHPGEPVWVDGPYGAFSVDRYPQAPGFVYVAGGIGMAPMIGMLRTLAARGDRRPQLLFAAHSAWDRILLREFLDALRGQLDLRVVHVLEDPADDWDGERGRIDRQMLDRHLPANRTSLEYFICGPVAMSRNVEHCLHALRVPVSRIHTELFDIV